MEDEDGTKGPEHIQILLLLDVIRATPSINEVNGLSQVV
jgi:hypothetical protein